MSKTTPKPENLLVEVRALLQQHKGRWAEIAKECEVSYSWLSQFSRGLIPDSGHLRLVRIRDHLKGKAPAVRVKDLAARTST